MLKEYAFADELALPCGNPLETSQFLNKDTALTLQLHDEYIWGGGAEQCVCNPFGSRIKSLEVLVSLVLLHCLELVA